MKERSLRKAIEPFQWPARNSARPGLFLFRAGDFVIRIEAARELVVFCLTRNANKEAPDLTFEMERSEFDRATKLASRHVN